MTISIQERELMHHGIVRPLSQLLATKQEYTWANKPSAVDFGVGQVWFSDIEAMGYSDGEVWIVNENVHRITVSINNTAAQNTTAIQAALNNGGKIFITGTGTALINDTLILHDDSDVTVDYGLTLKQSTTVAKTMFKTSAIDNAVGTTVTIAWTQGIRATVTHATHGKSVGDYVWFSGADQSQYSGIFPIVSVTNSNTYVIILDRYPIVSATGTITARTPNKNITLNINGVLDYDHASKTGGLAIDKLAVILSGVNIVVNAATINNASKYCLCVGAIRHAKLTNIKSDVTNSDLIKIYGPAYDVEVDDIRGYSGDDFISLQGVEPPAYIGYMWSKGDVINIRIKNIKPNSSSISSTITLYASDSGETIDNIFVDNVDVFNRITIRSNDGGVAGLVGRIVLSNLKAPDDSAWANGGVSVKLSGTVTSMIVQNVVGSYWPKEYITVDSTATIKKLSINNCTLGAGANYIVNNAGTINKLTIRDNDLDNFLAGSYLRLVKNSKTINLLDIFNNRCNRLTSAIEQVAGVTTGGIISFRDNYLTNTYGVFELIQDSEVRFTGNVGDVVTNKYILNINGAGKSVKVHTRENVITFASLAVFLKRTVGSELISVFGTDIPVAIDLLTRTIPGQRVKAASSIGTILINEECINDTTNAVGSWHQSSNLSLVY